MKLRFDVLGEPKPQPRPRAKRRGLHAGVYQEVTPWRSLMTHEAGLQRKKLGCELTGPIAATFHFRMPRIKSLQDKDKPHVTRPDLDNLCKETLDAMQKVLFANDTQVNALLLTKRYAKVDEPPGCLIELVTEGSA